MVRLQYYYIQQSNSVLCILNIRCVNVGPAPLPPENQSLILFFVAFASSGIWAIFCYYLPAVALGILNNLNRSAGLDTKS